MNSVPSRYSPSIRIPSILALVVCLLPFAIPGGAQAGTGQGEQAVAVDAVEIDLWPEYDRAEMLVIEKIRLAPSASLPSRIRFRIPAVAGEPNAVAEENADGRLVVAPYERRVEGDWAVIDLTASRPDIRIEYYDPGLARDGDLREFGFVWPGGHPVRELTVRVQQPPGARDLETEPEASATSRGSDGLSYHTVAFGRVAAAETVELTLRYEKADDDLTMESAMQRRGGSQPDGAGGIVPGEGMGMGGPPEAPGARPPGDPSRVPPWVYGLVAALAVIGGAGWWVWHRRRQRQDLSAGAAAGRRRAPGSPSADEPDSFCTRCGAPARAEDRFCHACGHRLQDDD